MAGAGATHNAYFSITGNQLIAQHDFSGDLNATISVRVRVTDSTGNFFEKIIAAPVQAPALHVKINEVNYNPARNTQRSEFIELHNSAGAIVDKVAYSNTAPWPAPPNGDGPSLELLNPALDNTLGGNWRASTATQTAVTYVAAGSSGWRYRKGVSEASTPITAWRAAAFTEDGSWLTGATPLGLFKKNSDTAVATLAETGVTLATQLPDMATYVSSNANSGTNYTVS